MKSFGAFFLVAIVLTLFIIEFTTACDCEYHPGGCTIDKDKPPAEGHKCKCRYQGAWTCEGVEIECDAGEKCPANCTSYQCCVEGGGDCGGY